MQVLLDHGVGSMSDPCLDDVARYVLLNKVRNTPMPEGVRWRSPLFLLAEAIGKVRCSIKPPVKLSSVVSVR
jgi:hypothetical protein